MGNLVNPTVLRLKNNIYWNSTWVVYNNSNYSYILSNDYFLFNYINWFFKQLFITKLNWFFLISHYKILRYNNKIIILFFFKDYFVKKFIKNFWLTFKKKNNFYINRSKINDHSYFLLENIKQYLFKHNFQNFLFIDYSLLFTFRIFKFFNNNYIIIIKNIIVILLLNLITCLNYFLFSLIFYLKINKYLKVPIIKNNIYIIFNNIYKYLLILNNIFYILKLKFLFKNFITVNYLFHMYQALFLLTRNFYTLRYKYFYSMLLINNKIYDENFYDYSINKQFKLIKFIYINYTCYYWYILNLKKYIFLNLKYNFLKNYILYNKTNLCVYFYDIKNVNFFTSKLISKHIIIGLKKGLTLNRIIFPLLRKMYNKQLNIYSGWKILCSGRFQKKGRARKQWYSKGRVPLGTYISNLDYTSAIVKLRNGICSIKIFILKLRKFNYNI